MAKVQADIAALNGDPPPGWIFAGDKHESQQARNDYGRGVLDQDAYLGAYNVYRDAAIAIFHSTFGSLLPWGRLFNLPARTRGISVIGPRATYRQFAQKIGAKFLNVTDDAWTWAKNEKFLAGVVERGDDVIFAGKFNLNQLDKTSVLAKEIKYLENHGYQWTSDFTKMVLMK